MNYNDWLANKIGIHNIRRGEPVNIKHKSSFKDFLTPIEIKAKVKHKVRLTRKNKLKLREYWENRYLDLYGHTFENTFHVTYVDAFIESFEYINKHGSILEKLLKTNNKGWNGTIVVPIKF